MSMNNIYYYLLAAAIVVVGVGIIYFYYNKKKQVSKQEDRVKTSNELIRLLGGFDNIIKYEFRRSRFKVEVNNLSLVKKEEIQALGANGIMEVNNTVQIILGAESEKLKAIIDDLDK